MSDDMTPPEGFKEYDGAENSVELEPGDELVGVVLGVQEGQSEYGKWHRLKIRTENQGTVEYFCKGQAKTAAANGEVETADEVWIGVDPEQSTYTDDDGEEHAFHEHRFAVKEQE